MSTTPNVPYRLEFSVEVPGTPEQVWQAIATAQGMSAWFLPTEIDERAGGSLHFAMGPDMGSDGQVTGWDPPRRLVYEEDWAALMGKDPDELSPLTSEFLVEAQSGGTCVVRVTSSGFGTGADWESEFWEEMGIYWMPYFDNLRLYLSHFPGQVATQLEVTASHPGDGETLWSTLRDTLGLAGVGTPVELRDTTGTVEVVGDRQALVRLTAPVPGMLNIYVFEEGAGKSLVGVRAYLFSEDAKDYVRREESAWEAWLQDRVQGTMDKGGTAMTVEAVTHTAEAPGATIVYDVRGPLPTVDGRPPLLLIGQPMDATGFATLASHFPDRTVVTYDPRGLGRSIRTDGRTDNNPQQHAEDLHRLVEALGAGEVEIFGSSGGAVDGLALVVAHPEDVRVLVAHEPPLTHLLPDANAVLRAEQAINRAYQEGGFGHGMARFIAYTSWEGELTDEFFDRAAPDPAAFGLPSEDDGSRDDPLLSGDSDGVVAWTPDLDALLASGVRLVIAAGEESARQVTGRSAGALAARLGLPLTMFPSHHGGFVGPEFGWPGQPEAFAARLREVLDAQGR